MNDLLQWKNPSLTGSILLVGNFFLLSSLFSIPLLSLALQYGFFPLMVFGLALRIAKIGPSHFALSAVLPKESITEFAAMAWDGANRAVEAALPVLLWEQEARSALWGIASLYVLPPLLAVIGTDLLVFLGFNAVFVYGKWSEEIHDMTGPPVAAVRQNLASIWARIPRYEDEKKDQ